REKHPKYIQTAHEIQEFQSRLDEAVRQLPKTVAAGYEKARAGELVLDQALREQEAAALQLSRTAIDYNVLAREVETDRALFQSIMSRLKEASLTRTLPDARVRLTQEAIAPAEPLDSGSFGRWAKAVCGGFLLSVALALGLNSRDNRLKGVDQVERALRLPVLAAVPQTRRTRHSPLLQSEEDPAVVEAFRLLRAALQVGAWKDSSRIVLFTSSVEGEGKTFCSARYASSLAWQGFKTLIIDGDLRRPSLEQALFGDVSGNPGIVNVLTGETTLADAVRHTSVENLSCLTSGPVSANPAELLAHGRLPALFDQALAQFDRIVVDSAPLHAVSDTFLMLEHVHAVSLVVRAHGTPLPVVTRAKSLLERGGAPNTHLVLNRTSTRRLYRSYYYRYGNYNACAAQAA
ncbi:MAG TPA: polysaccharide biosynthesis tyrosine autokinase, partial [Verrucomicrobiae bacterium]